MAKREKARLATESQVGQRVASRILALVRDELSFIWLALLAFLVLNVSVPWDGFSALKLPGGNPSDFIGVLWQVQGAALGLSLAVVLFVFQSVHGNRLGGSLREFAEETWLFPIFYAGLVGLILDGLVLLGVGRDAPGGWAASWAVIWAAATAVGLGFLFVFTIRAIDPRALHQLRLRRAKRAIGQEIEGLILRRIALVLLDRFCKEHSIEYVSMFGRPQPQSILLRAKRDGIVRDIRLRRLRMLALDAVGRGIQSPALHVELGSAVRVGTELVSIDPRYRTGHRKLLHGFRIKRRQQDEFSSVIEGLHDEALVAIRTPSPSTYAAISDLYEHMLLVLPETWARYGQQYVDGIAGGATPFEFTSQDLLERQLYEEMTQAVGSGSRDIAHDALDLPIIVAQRALELRALALTKRMISLWVAARRAMLHNADDRDVRGLLEWSWLRMSEYALRPESQITEEASSRESQELGRDLLLQVWDGYAALCKSILDIRPRDTELLTEINAVWDQPLRHWNPEHRDPQPWQVDFAEGRGDPAESIARMRAEVAENERQIDLKRDIVDWRALHRFGLLFWVLRNVRERGDNERWAPAWRTFAGYFGDVAQLAEILDKGIQADWEDRGRWSVWVMDAAPRREFGGIAVDFEFVQTFVVLALALVAPDGPPPQIEPLKFGRGRLEDPRRTVEDIIAIENLAPLLPADRLPERAELLIAALRDMQAKQKAREEQALIDADLDPALLQKFRDSLRSAWRTARSLRAAFSASNAVEAVTGNLGESCGSQVKRWLPKGLFTQEPSVHGLEHTAEEYGRSLAGWEWKALMRAADKALVDEVTGDTSPAERLRAAIAELRGAGYGASLVVMPIDWEIFQALDLAPARDRGGDQAGPNWLEEEEGRSSFVGTVDSVPVLDHQHVPDGSVYVFDLARFARFRELDVQDPPGPVRVEIKDYDETAIRQLVAAGRINFEEELTDEEQVRMIQQRVSLDAVYPFEIVVVDPAAARRVLVDLRGTEE